MGELLEYTMSLTDVTYNIVTQSLIVSVNMAHKVHVHSTYYCTLMHCYTIIIRPLLVN